MQFVTVQFIREAFEPKGLVAEADILVKRLDEGLKQAFACFNRGSGSEMDFEGPSMSVGDRIVIRTGVCELQFRVTPCGFREFTTAR